MPAEERLHARGERLRELALIEGNVPMANLLRSFWQPVALSRDVTPGGSALIKVFGEELALYRSMAGVPHLVGGRCAHRLSYLHTGWVDGEEIRCIYHGWTYDGTGQCTLRPAERDNGLPNVRVAGYPLHEYAGLIFAYMGKGEAPVFELGRKPAFEGGGFHVVRKQVWPANWLQFVENSMDAVHVSFVHAIGREGQFIKHVSQEIPELEYLETSAGVRQIATRGPGNVRISDWTFPNNNHIIVPGPIAGGGWMHVAIWNVPIDNTHTQRMHIYAMPDLAPDQVAALDADWAKHQDYDPADHHNALMHERAYPEDRYSDLTNAQDYVAQVGQGPLVDREHETLGRSDAGIALLRRLLYREMDAINAGKAPKQWRPLEESIELPTQHAGAST
jgi:5,5'-dehydrodivanillate O-demethylase oxygenase subunit